MDYEVPIQGIEGTSRGADEGPDPADLRGERCGDCAWIGIAGRPAYAAVGTRRLGTGEAGAVRQRPNVEKVGGRVPRANKAVLGTASVGARVVLCDGGRGR